MASLKKALLKHTIKRMKIGEVIDIVSEVQCPYCSENILSKNHFFLNVIHVQNGNVTLRYLVKAPKLHAFNVVILVL